MPSQDDFMRVDFDRVTSLRKQRGVTLDELRDKAGRIATGTWHARTKKNQLTYQEAVAVARVLGVGLGAFARSPPSSYLRRMRMFTRPEGSTGGYLEHFGPPGKILLAGLEHFSFFVDLVRLDEWPAHCGFAHAVEWDWSDDSGEGYREVQITLPPTRPSSMQLLLSAVLQRGRHVSLRIEFGLVHVDTDGSVRFRAPFLCHDIAEFADRRLDQRNAFVARFWVGPCSEFIVHSPRVSDGITVTPLPRVATNAHLHPWTLYFPRAPHHLTAKERAKHLADWGAILRT